MRLCICMCKCLTIRERLCVTCKPKLSILIDTSELCKLYVMRVCFKLVTCYTFYWTTSVKIIHIKPGVTRVICIGTCSQFSFTE